MFFNCLTQFTHIWVYISMLGRDMNNRFFNLGDAKQLHGVNNTLTTWNQTPQCNGTAHIGR